MDLIDNAQKLEQQNIELEVNTLHVVNAIENFSIAIKDKPLLLKKVFHLLFHFTYFRNKLFFIKSDRCTAPADKLIVTFYPSYFFRCVSAAVGARE